MFDKRIRDMTMKMISSLRMKIVVGLILLALLTSGCDLPASILMGLERICNQPELVVNMTIDTNDVLCTSNKCSLRDAISTSNACPGIQTIRIPVGSYTLTRVGAGEDHNRTGDLDITDSVNIVGEGFYPLTSVIIDGNQNDRVFDIHPGATVSMVEVVIQDGLADSGGGIRNQGALTLNNVQIVDNQSNAYHGLGAGIYNQGQLTLNQTGVEGNMAAKGGGLYNLGTVMVNFSQFDGNEAAEGGGGAIYNGRTIQMLGPEILRNQGPAAAILNTASGSLTASRVEIHDNRSEVATAGIWNEGTLSLSRSSIVHNVSSYANSAQRNVTGIVVNRGHMSMTNITIAENNSNAIVVQGQGTFQISYSTFHNPDSAYEIRYDSGVSPNGLHISNSILAGHSTNGNCSGPLNSDGFNLDSSSIRSCGFNQASDLNGVDPHLRPLTLDNGTEVLPLAFTSPAVDSADPANCVAIDQRGVTRPQPSGGHCDRGAYELIPLSVPSTIPAPPVAPLPEATLFFPTATFTENAFCRVGPGTVYPDIGSFEKGQQAQIDGQNDFSPRWYWVQMPNSNEHCWVSEVTVQISGPMDAVPERAAPPTPVPTKRSARGPACLLISSDKQCNSTSGCIFDYKTKKCVKK